MSTLKAALAWLKEWLHSPIDRRAVLCACWSTAIVITGELIVFWWRHASEHLIGLVLVPTGWCSAYIAASMGDKRIRDRRRRRPTSTLHTPRKGFPPGARIVEEIYSALLNLGYHDTEVRQALYNLRARDLVNFDTGFAAAMAQLREPARTI